MNSITCYYGYKHSVMGIFDLFGIIGSIIDPASSYDDMQDKIESDNEDVIGDRFHVSDGVEPEHDFNDLVTDIMNDFVNNPDTEDGKGIITDDNR